MNFQSVSQAIAEGPAMAGQIIDGACAMRGFQRVGDPNASAMSTTVPGAPQGSCPIPGVAQSQGIQGNGYCGVYSQAIREAFARKCQAACDPCWEQLLDQSIARQSWAMVRNQVGRSFLRFSLSGYTADDQPTPDPDSGTTTNFVAGPTIAAGNSVLLRQDPRYTLPYRPGCLKLTLGFSAGEMDNNMTHVQAKIYVIRRGSFVDNGNLRAFATEWNPDEFYSGDMFRCGTSCAEVNIIGSLGCSIPVEHVGDDNELLIQIFNDGAAAATVNSINATMTFAGLKKACCESCNSGGGCSCGK